MPQPIDPGNLHGTALTVGDRGVLIRGASGSGKTTLALALLRLAQNSGRNARLVADDQVLIAPVNGRLLCMAPATIAGLVEVRGSTPRKIACEPAAVIDLVVDLVDPDRAPRFSEGDRTEIAGCGLPLLVVPERNVEAASLAIASHLSLPPFG